jgi:hypothetical protein
MPTQASDLVTTQRIEHGDSALRERTINNTEGAIVEV